VDDQEKYDYWLKLAQSSLHGANLLYEGGERLLAAYECQQAIEKLVKGLYTLYIDDNIPRTHNINIRLLIEKIETKLSVEVREERYNFFEMLSTYAIEGRYPEYKKAL
jgi:HEPN domain-containing protein